MDSKNSLTDTIYKKKETIVSRKIAGELFLVPIHGKLAEMQRIFALTTVAEYIWDQLDGEKTLEEIRNSILTTFEVEKEQADSDLNDFITQLLKADLIEGIE